MHENLPIDTTIEVRDRCLCLHTLRAARRLARMFDELLRPYGLTNGQFSLLMSLNRPHAPRLSDLTTLLGMDRTTLTAALKVVERRGLVEARPDPQDRRARRLHLTRAGQEALIAALPAWRDAHARLEAALDGITAEALRKALDGLGKDTPEEG